MAAPAEPTRDEDVSKPDLPKGVVLGKDGKPCRLCTSAASWRSLSKQASQFQSQSQPKPDSQQQQQQQQQQQAQPQPSIPKTITSAASTTRFPSPTQTQTDCPPDVDDLGRSTWTLLHSLTAAYPPKASTEQQAEMRTFLSLFSRLYPCWVCADDFRAWMAEPSGRNQPRLGGRQDFGTWMCEAHNEVNRKLGKKEFDCRFWEERWRTGWKDGRCD